MLISILSLVSVLVSFSRGLSPTIRPRNVVTNKLGAVLGIGRHGFGVLQSWYEISSLTRTLPLPLHFPHPYPCPCPYPYQAKPDPTFFDADEYAVDAITPNRGPLYGGTRVSISGSGFNTNFFEGGNYVYIGTDDAGWTTCDVIEGACTVKCGGPKTLICDTNPWISSNDLSASGWVDLMVLIQVFANGGAGEFVTVTLEDAFYFYAIHDE